MRGWRKDLFHEPHDQARSGRQLRRSTTDGALTEMSCCVATLGRGRRTLQGQNAFCINPSFRISYMLLPFLQADSAL